MPKKKDIEPLTEEQKKLRDDYFAAFPNLIALVTKLMPQAVLGMRFKRGMTVPEIESIAWKGVMQAVRQYRTPSTATFSTYAANAIRNEIIAEYVYVNRDSRKTDGRVVQLENAQSRKNENGSFHWGMIPSKMASEIEEKEQAEHEHKIRLRIRFALDDLGNERLKKIVMMRFGIPDNMPMTLDEVSKIIGVSRERIRQLSNRAFDELKPKLASLWDAI